LSRQRPAALALRRAGGALVDRLTAPTRALPLDVFRALVGVLSLGYCARQIAQVPLYWAPDGGMVHALSRQAFWFTWQPLFQPGMSAVAIRALLGAGCALALGVALGIYPRASAAALYFLVVCGYRFNFLLLSIDDAIVHLLLLWVALMPVGTTFTAPDLLRRGRAARARWFDARVPGATVRFFLANLVLLYAVAGSTKWTSPLWRSGDALYAVLRLPCSWVAEDIGPQHLPWLRVASHAALVLEPLIAVGLCLPARWPTRWPLAATMAAFHLGIVATLDVPFANLGCLAALPLVFRAGFPRVAAPAPAPAPSGARRPFGRPEALGGLVLVLLTGAMGSSVLQPQWRQPDLAHDAEHAPAAVRGATDETGGVLQTTFFGALWVLGLAQQYRLLDWIDERNFHVVTTFRAQPADGSPVRVLPTESLFPRGMRAGLLLSYVGGVTWMPVPPEHRQPVRLGVLGRVATRYCRAAHADQQVELHADFERVEPRRVVPREQITLATFRCNRAGGMLALSPGPPYDPGHARVP
jgi:hypothetical protein